MTPASLRTRWRVRSLRFRIVAITAAASTLAIVLALGAYLLTLRTVLDNTATTAATDQAGRVVAQLADRPGDPSAVLQDVSAQGSILQLVDATGRVISYSDNAAAAQPLADLRPGAGQVQSAHVHGIPTDENEPYVVVARGLSASEGPAGATLLVATPVQNETVLIEGASIALGLLALLLLGGLLWLINRVLSSALGRVERIRSSVAEIGASRSDVRVPVPSGDDEITHLAETMNAMLDRLHEADAAQRAFVSDASHELRSPLTAIRMIADTSPEGIDPDGTRVVRAEALRLQHLVDDLLTLAKIDDAAAARPRVEVDLDDLLIEEVRRLRATSTLRVEADIEAARLEGDPVQLARVVRNLVDNASRHARTAVRLGCAATADGSVTVTVDNDGEPVPLDRREAIFDRFTRLQDSRDRDTGGSGLGLAIVRALVESYGGTVVTTETPEGWCRFEVRIPG